jgi:hypothetical protein
MLDRLSSLASRHCTTSALAYRSATSPPNWNAMPCNREGQPRFGRRRPIDAEVTLKPDAATSEKKNFTRAKTPPGGTIRPVLAYKGMALSDHAPVGAVDVNSPQCPVAANLIGARHRVSCSRATFPQARPQYPKKRPRRLGRVGAVTGQFRSHARQQGRRARWPSGSAVRAKHWSLWGDGLQRCVGCAHSTRPAVTASIRKIEDVAVS